MDSVFIDICRELSWKRFRDDESLTSKHLIGLLRDKQVRVLECTDDDIFILALRDDKGIGKVDV